MGKVINAYTLSGNALPAHTVFVGHGSRWASPFREGRDGTLEEINARFNLAIASQEDVLADLDELKGKDLVCYCVQNGKSCYAHTLAYLASIPLRARLDWAAQVKANQNAGSQVTKGIVQIPLTA